jgi:hypothetical protein
MRDTQLRLRITLLAAVAVLAASGLQAGLDIDFGASVQLDDRAEVWVAISSRYFDQDRRTVESLGVRYNDPDDLAVALYIGKRSGRSPQQVFSLYDRGLSWWDVGRKVDLGPDVWFVETSRAPAPPYGRAYGYWNKHRQDRRHVMVLTNDDIRNLVAARVIHEYFEVPIEEAMRIRAAGDNLRYIMAEQYRQRHGKTD